MRSHVQYNVKLSIIAFIEQREWRPGPEKCFGNPSYNRQDIVCANKIACKLLKQASNGYYSD